MDENSSLAPDEASFEPNVTDTPRATSDTPSPRPADARRATPAANLAGGTGATGDDDIADPVPSTGPKKRRRGSRGGKGRRPASARPGAESAGDSSDSSAGAGPSGTPGVEPAEGASDTSAPGVSPRPKIGDTRPAPKPSSRSSTPAATKNSGRRSAGGTSRSGRPSGATATPDGGAPRADRRPADATDAQDATRTDQTRDEASSGGGRRRRSGGRSAPVGEGFAGSSGSEPSTTNGVAPERRRGRERNGRPVGRYLMCVQVRPHLTQVAVLEGRNLIEHYVSRPSDDATQIHGNIYLGRVQNVLPGMEAAFVDIGTPKNAVLYRGDVQYDADDIVEKGSDLRIEQMLRPKQLIICQVTKNPIGAKGARLTQEVSLPGRFVVLIPNSRTYGISKRLPDDVRKRLRSILDRVKPAEHGLIVRTAAEHASEHELRADMSRLLEQWERIESKAKRANSPTLLYREPELAVRVIREEFNAEYRGIVIDDARLHDEVREYVGAYNPELVDRVELHDTATDGLPVFERHHVHEQLHKALDRKVWLPSGGSLIIEHTEALTVIDVNTGKNVGTTNLEETVFRNNLEAAEEVAKQLRLRDIGGIVVIDFIDMEIRENRKKVVDAFRAALARDKTRTQVFDISELGLVEMTRKRIGEGLLVNFADECPNCHGRGVVVHHELLA